jgi:hemerythrin
MTFISWGADYELGIPLIDAQHKKLFEIINTYHDSEISTEDAFAALISYIDFHFKTEEYYFDKFNYKFTKEHKAAHEYYKKTVFELHDKYLKNNSKNNIRVEIEEFVKDWISDHIRLSDVVFKTCFLEHGLGSREPILPEIRIR